MNTETITMEAPSPHILSQGTIVEAGSQINSHQTSTNFEIRPSNRVVFSIK